VNFGIGNSGGKKNVDLWGWGKSGKNWSVGGKKWKAESVGKVEGKRTCLCKGGGCQQNKRKGGKDNLGGKEPGSKVFGEQAEDL